MIVKLCYSTLFVGICMRPFINLKLGAWMGAEGYGIIWMGIELMEIMDIGRGPSEGEKGKKLIL